jgi:peptidoglycan/LPS O-acetylase OafA/YrhL
MKRAIMVFVVTLMVIVTVALWISATPGKLSTTDLLSLGVLLIVVGFAIFIGFRRLSSARKGEPAEDELSKKVQLRAAAISYYISIYIWLAILFIKDRVKLDSDEMIGAGILGMAITWAISWLIIHLRGIRNE